MPIVGDSLILCRAPVLTLADAKWLSEELARIIDAATTSGPSEVEQIIFDRRAELEKVLSKLKARPSNVSLSLRERDALWTFAYGAASCGLDDPRGVWKMLIGKLWVEEKEEA